MGPSCSDKALFPTILKGEELLSKPIRVRRCSGKRRKTKKRRITFKESNEGRFQKGEPVQDRPHSCSLFIDIRCFTYSAPTPPSGTRSTPVWPGAPALAFPNLVRLMAPTPITDFRGWSGMQTTLILVVVSASGRGAWSNSALQK